jgi:hypothetical protein
MTINRTIGEHVDALMDQASEALVRRDYFLAERLAGECLIKALTRKDYQRAARIINPLQEARRQKRDMAWDVGKVTVLVEPISETFVPEAGAYLMVPPRVGQDARVLRARADQAGVPIIILAREPRTSAGRCPIVAVGPATIRAYIDEPTPAPAPAPAPSSGKGRKKAAEPAALVPAPIVNAFGTFVTPSLAWMLMAGEALGDAAIEQVSTMNIFQRVDELAQRLAAHPDHEKLHQRLREACEAAAREALINPAGARSATALPEDDQTDD